MKSNKKDPSIMEVVMKDKRKAYEEKLDAQLKEWNARIALLKAKDENTKADAKMRLLQNYRGIGAQTG